ncbi:hypothetical protein NQ318_003601 [Aromia moschata]|uniref:Secreted protein n=1 Tax=Aromia moschata TaxID=1265417 RepID=A0AAV8YXK3_9CUCU|nr:hypothetical protein NQ318_003601 [Aromia moschata]
MMKGMNSELVTVLIFATIRVSVDKGDRGIVTLAFEESSVSSTTAPTSTTTVNVLTVRDVHTPIKHALKSNNQSYIEANENKKRHTGRRGCLCLPTIEEYKRFLE